jgi:DNA-directed RNA polymerase specialized sigma subunit
VGDESLGPGTGRKRHPIFFKLGGVVHCEYESRALLNEAIEKLPARHRQVVDLYFFAGYRLRAVAPSLSVGKQRIAQLRDDAVEIVRDEVVSS